MNLTGTVSIVTGGNGGLGQRICHHLAEAGSSVAVVYNNRGLAHRGKNDAESAIADFSRAIELDLAYRDAHNNLGLALSDMGRYAEAVELHTKAIEIDPSSWHAYSHRGLALWSLGERERAAIDYETVAKLSGAR